MTWINCFNLNKATISSTSSGMSSIQDLRPMLFIARAFGLAPYTITDSSITISRRAILYSTPWMLCYLYSMYNRIAVYFNEDAEYKYRALSITRTILVVTALIFDVATCLARDKKLQTALNHLRKYDLAVKYDVAINAKMLMLHSWTTFGFMFFYFLVIGWFTYFYESYGKLMAAIIYVYLYLPLSIAVLKFVTFVTSIFLRFRHLNRMLYPGFMSIMMEVDSEFKRLQLRDVCWLHQCLLAAAQEINSLYSMQLLLWFLNFTVNTITRISNFMESQKNFDSFRLIRDGGLVIIFVLQVTLMAAICHLTSKQANEVGAVVFSPNSRYFRVRIEPDKEDKFSIGQYFALHSLHFTAAFGFFRINLPLLLKIVGAMTTYLVILKSPTKC